MEALKLVKMANEIGMFFESEPDHAVAVAGVAQHLKRFWEIRMRRELLAWLDGQAGAGLRPLVLEALRKNREDLLPRAPTV
jgi:formate dehydrogenase subunit delta